MNKSRYYVYCLIDPTNNHQPFYVGKGTEKRVGVHLERKELSIPIDEINANDIKISAIKNKNAQVYERLFMWNLSEDNAFSVETALINVLPNLTNKSQGRNLENVRRREIFKSWEDEDDVDLVHRLKEPLDYLDAEDPTRSVFFSKTVAYNAAGSDHKLAMGPYHRHKKTLIKMWTGNIEGTEWINEYDPKSGNYYIGGERVLRRHGSWEEIKRIHEEVYTYNLDTKENNFLCFTTGLSPRGFVHFLGVYKDDWEQSRKEKRIVRKRVNTKYKME